MKLSHFIMIVLVIACVGLVASFVMVPSTVHKELRVGIVGSYDALIDGQITGGRYWLGDVYAPEFSSLPIKTDPRSRHVYDEGDLPTVESVQVPLDASFDDILARLMPNAELIEPAKGPTSLTSTGEHPIRPAVEMWQCFLKTEDDKLDSCCILVFTNVFDKERAALVMRGKRSGSRWLGTVKLEHFAASRVGGYAGLKKAAEGHLLSVSVSRMRSLDGLPEELIGLSWVEPGGE